ncbi:MAG: CoB--CoM heterodisulfide reductase iron-sulfur subunit B family protein [Desulfobacterales bacterium]
MNLAFYPGCSLEGMANDYARSITAVFDKLNVDLVEIEDWTCCGATAAHSMSEAMAVVLPARNLAAAEKMGLDIVSPCANCFNRLIYSRKMILKSIYEVPWPVTGKTKVYDMARFLAEPEMIEQIKENVIMPLKGLNIVSYYGCQMVRPPRITGFDDFENPRTMDRIADAIGANALDWSYKATCCGASIGLGRRDIQLNLSERLLQKAHQAGAEAVIVSCPLCQNNLDMVQTEKKGQKIPVFYFTELIRLAFEGKTCSIRDFRMHLTDAGSLLRKKGLID